MTLRANKQRLLMVGGTVFLAVAAFAAGCAYAQQPHMQAALGYLQNARGELQVAEHDKGGHRVTAIRLINEAIDEVHLGINAGS